MSAASRRSGAEEREFTVQHVADRGHSPLGIPKIASWISARSNHMDIFDYVDECERYPPFEQMAHHGPGSRQDPVGGTQQHLSTRQYALDPLEAVDQQLGGP